MFFLRQFIIETKTLIYLSNLNHKLQSLSICKFCKNIWGWSEFEFLLRRIMIPDCIPTMNKPIFFVAWIYYNSLNTLQKQEPEWIICFTVHTMRRMQIFYILFTSMNENMHIFFHRFVNNYVSRVMLSRVAFILLTLNFVKRSIR